MDGRGFVPMVEVTSAPLLIQRSECRDHRWRLRRLVVFFKGDSDGIDEALVRKLSVHTLLVVDLKAFSKEFSTS